MEKIVKIQDVNELRVLQIICKNAHVNIYISNSVYVIKVLSKDKKVMVFNVLTLLMF